jgi:hypothetical protein
VNHNCDASFPKTHGGGSFLQEELADLLHLDKMVSRPKGPQLIPAPLLCPSGYGIGKGAFQPASLLCFVQVRFRASAGLDKMGGAFR